VREYRFLSGAPFACLLAFGCISLSAGAQTSGANEWTWMGGSSTVPSDGGGQLGVYGMLGTPAPGNVPGGRTGATSWTDKEGNFWLFGGGGYATEANTVLLNDLWKFNPSTNQWAWMSGSSTQPCTTITECSSPGVYGTLGEFAPGNVPGSRFGVASWTDNNGNLWLFGGEGADAELNDLWEFNPVKNEWAWMGGSSTNDFDGQPGVYGTLGTPAAGNVPGGRYEATTWTDSSGNFWLFGGYGEDIYGNESYLNDLWEFSPSTNEWTWMGGNSIVACGGNCGISGVYGTLGVSSTGNSPGSRDQAISWTDNSGNLWLFGGFGVDANNGLGELNDLWEFNPSSNEWTWMSGSSTWICPYLLCGRPGVYGTLAIASAGSVAGSRNAASGWADSAGHLWLFGGWSFDVNSNYGMLQDLWEYDISTNQWTWMGGGDATSGCVAYYDAPTYCGGQAGVYGTLGTPAAGTIPGARNGAVSWVDGGGNLWLFGGGGYDAVDNNAYLNDLWKFHPSTTTLPPAITPTFDVGSGTYTAGGPLTISDAMSNAILYYTTDGTTPTTSSTLYNGPLAVSHTETVQAIAIAPGYPNSGVASATYVILPPAASPTFSVAPGTYTYVQTVTISDTTSGATIYFTTDGKTTPTTTSTPYSGAITVSASETIQAIAVASGYGDSAVASATYTINLPPDFSLAVSPASFTVMSGQSGTTVVSVTPENGFSTAVSFSCSGLPSGASCSFSPATVTPSGAATSTTLTVSTSTSTAAVRRNASRLLTGAALAAMVCCFGLGKRRFRMFFLLAVSAAGLGLLASCGGSSSGGGSTGSQPVTSTITVTATAGSIQHTTTLSLTVN
jgi:N-acetylneuraminic acid mutarotase